MGGVRGLGPAQLVSQAISLVLGGASVLYAKESVRLPPSPLSPFPFQVSPPKPKDLNRNVYKMSGRKETVLDLAKFVDKGVQVKLTGGRQVTGTLKGYDQLLNLVLDGAIEFLRDADDPLKTTDQTRSLGLIICRGTAVMLVSPTDGTDEIANPFNQPDGS
ncbi:hypothetical protein Syun_017400 [Stephania yunnanensis]|uniref:Sm domain-containing protein n=1 Tax=Stephania yunnanensis TaxID=152371 RepID=A0AAP0P311_9MAGN